MFGYKCTTRAERREFKALKRTGFALVRNTPLLPECNPVSALNWKRPIEICEHAKMLNLGTVVDFLKVRKVGRRIWYKIRVRNSLISGWINSLAMIGGK